MKLTIITSLLGMASAQAATVLGLTADTVNSSAAAFGGTVAGVVSDTFLYDPATPTTPSPNRVFAAGVGYHADLGEGVDALLSYTLSGGAHTTTAGEATVVVDLYGRSNEACCNGRDDNIDVQLFNGDYVTAVATVSGLSIDNAGTGHVRATFGGLAVGTQFDRIRIVGHDSDGGAFPANNYFTLMEARLATVPEPSSTALLGLGGLALIMRRRK